MISIRYFFIVLLFTTIVSNSVQAITITDRWPGDLNTILSTDTDQAANTFDVLEDYNEDNKIHFPSHDGKAVVDILPTGAVHYFDKIIDLENAVGTWLFRFTVHNTTPWDGSDYHFLFFDESFSNPINVENILGGWGNTVIFNNSSLVSNELQFWAPGWHRSDQTAEYGFELDTDALRRIGASTFGIRQVATVPEPTTLALMSLAIAGFGFQRRKKSCE